MTIGTVEGSLYQIKGGTDEITFTVDPVRATDDSDANASLRLTGTMGFGDPAGNRYIYTGEAVVPGFEYDLFADMWGYGITPTGRRCRPSPTRSPIRRRTRRPRSGRTWRSASRSASTAPS